MSDTKNNGYRVFSEVQKIAETKEIVGMFCATVVKDDTLPTGLGMNVTYGGDIDLAIVGQECVKAERAHYQNFVRDVQARFEALEVGGFLGSYTSGSMEAPRFDGEPAVKS